MLSQGGCYEYYAWEQAHSLTIASAQLLACCIGNFISAVGPQARVNTPRTLPGCCLGMPIVKRLQKGINESQEAPTGL